MLVWADGIPLMFCMVSCLYMSTGPPATPQNFRVTSIVDDPRPEFYGHAVISLEWDPPEGKFVRMCRINISHTCSVIIYRCEN